MSSVSSIRPRLNIYSKMVKNVDNISAPDNKNLNDSDVAIINNENKEYIAHIRSKSQLNKNSVTNVNAAQSDFSDDSLKENDNNSDEVLNPIYLTLRSEKPIDASSFVSAPEYYNSDNSINNLYNKCLNNSDIRWRVLKSAYFSSTTVSNLKKLQKSFKKLIQTSVLNQIFLNNLLGKTIYLNRRKISSNQFEDIVHALHKSVKDLEAQQLISTYTHPKMLDIALENLSTRFPEVEYRESHNERIVYEIDKINSDTYKVAVTKFADLKPSNFSDDMSEINQYGIRSTMIINKNVNPEVRYAFFVS
ncbi:hypothetical protein [Buchnera aphidicola]|uniref:hypothetical protein n=1 Tax=Buchnera aphidicola TaxID=9 RepID=UPI00094D2612|nr:hypothetical protein [Buchnera aphidicola]